MKTSSAAALGLVILAVGLVVWWQIFDAGSQTGTAAAPSGTVTEAPDTATPSVPAIIEPEVPTVDTLVPAPTPEVPIAEPPTVACPEDAKMCPDGSSVGRVGPQCEFAACPATPEPRADAAVYTCTPEMKQAEVCTMEYAPVCGMRTVQCVTTPCNPVPETFGNACGACATPGVETYTIGECTL